MTRAACTLERVIRRLPLVTAGIVVLVVTIAGVVVATSGGETSPVAAALVPSPSPSPLAVTPSPTPTPTPRVVPSPKPVHRGPLYALPAAPVHPEPCPAPPLPPGTPLPPMPAPKVVDARLPAPVAVHARHVSLSAVSGKGMWVTTWPNSQVDAAHVIAQSRAAGVRQLWVRTGGTKQGYYGPSALSSLLPAAHAAGIAVIAWDFPTLSDPVADARRARAALSGVFGGQRIDGFS